MLLLLPLRILVSLGICESVCMREWGNTFSLNGLWWCMGVTKLTGRDFVLFFSECGGSQLSLLSVYLFPCECVSLYCLKAFLYTIRYFYCMVYVCLLCEWTCKTRSRLFFFFSPKGLFGFRFHLFKKFVSIVFPSYNYLLFLFHYYQLELQLNIRFRLWELSTLLFITQMIVAPPTLLLRLVSAMFKNRMLFFFVVVWVECSDFSFYVFMFCSDWLKQRFRKRGGGAYIAHNLKKERRNGKE